MAQQGERDWPVPAERVKLWEDAFHKLHARVGDKEFSDVRPRRVFPLSNKADYLSLLDDKEKEVVLVAHPHKLDKDSRRALDKALGRMYYVAKILRVEEITESMGVTHWRVYTDHGYAAFEVVDTEHIRKLPRGRFLIVDVDGNRFEIEDASQLDPRSQALVLTET